MKTWKLAIFVRTSILRSGRGIPVRQRTKSQPNNRWLHTGLTPRIKCSRLQAALATRLARRGRGLELKEQKPLSIPSLDRAERTRPERPNKTKLETKETAERDWWRPAASLPQCSRNRPFRLSHSPGNISPYRWMSRRRWQNRQCAPSFPRSRSAWERLPPGS